MKKIATGLALGLGIGLILYTVPGKNHSTLHAASLPSIQTTNCTFYIFYLDSLDNKTSKAYVQTNRNWKLLSQWKAGKELFCHPGQDEACQLIVDERDTYTQGNERYLKPRVIINADKYSFSEAYYVKSFTSTGNYFYYIVNSDSE